MTIEELTEYLKQEPLLPSPVQLNPSHRIENVQLFLNSHLTPLQGQKVPLSKILQPMYDRLMEYRDLLERDSSRRG